MRFRLKLAGALAVGLAAAAPVSASLNPQHAGLQVALRAQGLYLGPIDAIIGPKTVAAVRRFQQTHRLHVTGIADLKTRRELGPLGTPLFGSRTLARGKFGWDVAVLQFLLNKRGVTRAGERVHGQADGGGSAQLSARDAPEGGRYRRPRDVRGARFADRRAGACGGSALVAQLHRQARRLAHGDRAQAQDDAVEDREGEQAQSGEAAADRRQASNSRRRSATRTTTAVSATNAGTVRSSLDHWAAHYGIDASLARALAWMESGYNNEVVSSVGAQGVMQLLPSTWDYVETVLIKHPVAHDADGNVHVGLAYLNHLLHAFNGNEHLALAGWYQGERAVRAHGTYKVSKVFVADVLALRQRM